MKRLASWLRQIANEIDPPARRGRPSRAAERNAAAVDALFAESECDHSEILCDCEHCSKPWPQAMHGWPEEPRPRGHWTDGPIVP